MDLTGVIISSVFWVFIAFCVFIGFLKQKKAETLRHETARILIEKNPSIDPETLAQIINPAQADIKTGAAHRLMKITGTIVAATGLGLWAMCLWFVFVVGDVSVLGLGGPATLVAFIGVGAIFAARFMPRPSAKDAETAVSRPFGNGSDL